MTRKIVASILVSISIGAIIAVSTITQSKLTLAQIKDNGVKMNEETRYFLKNFETPPSQGNKLVDKYGKNHSCHQLSITKNNKGKFVTEWTCWSED